MCLYTWWSGCPSLLMGKNNRREKARKAVTLEWLFEKVSPSSYFKAGFSPETAD